MNSNLIFSNVWVDVAAAIFLITLIGSVVLYVDTKKVKVKRKIDSGFTAHLWWLKSGE